MRICEGRESTQEAQEYLKRNMLSIMESVNWVCEDVFKEHEWHPNSPFPRRQKKC